MRTPGLVPGAPQECEGTLVSMRPRNLLLRCRYCWEKHARVNVPAVRLTRGRTAKALMEPLNGRAPAYGRRRLRSGCGDYCRDRAPRRAIGLQCGGIGKRIMCAVQRTRAVSAARSVEVRVVVTRTSRGLGAVPGHSLAQPAAHADATDPSLHNWRIQALARRAASRGTLARVQKRATGAWTGMAAGTRGLG